MPTIFESDRAAESRPHDKPRLESYDSGTEFSFLHWAYVRELVSNRSVPLDNRALIFVSETRDAAI